MIETRTGFAISFRYVAVAHLCHKNSRLDGCSLQARRFCTWLANATIDDIPLNQVNILRSAQYNAALPLIVYGVHNESATQTSLPSIVIRRPDLPPRCIGSDITSYAHRLSDLSRLLCCGLCDCLSGWLRRSMDCGLVWCRVWGSISACL
jgi:hypothetical protein